MPAEKQFQNKIVVITGASRGIGRATALAFAREGANLILAYHQNHDAMKSLLAEIQPLTKVTTIHGDIGNAATIEQIVAAGTAYGGVDVLVNNAGAIFDQGPATVTPEIFDTGMHTNLLGAMMLTQACVPLLRQRSGSNIVNVVSTFGIMGAAAVAVYTASKAGLINYTRSMAVELSPAIRVNALAPGIIDTDMTTNAGAELIDLFVSQTPLKRLGRPEEMADAILYMASDKASFMTGHTLIADGGHILVN